MTDCEETCRAYSHRNGICYSKCIGGEALHHPSQDMKRSTTDALLAEIDQAMAAYSASIDRGLALAAEMRQLADAFDGGMADANAELREWI
jgi:hypothetical protein